ncbi:ATP-binding protein [uncultured Tolumonas sp.]|uniref:ATP-binding protein n=1 Tax=uncultured Tolumonas sp. TaxID=263765 RepID=UPI002A0A7EC7|nr:ATP-binding protein [uncultured Tolumonas sp.]
MIIHELSQIGYVVSLEGTKIRINLLEGHKGQLAAHRSGINSVSQPGDLIGFESGRFLIVARVTDMSFVEPEKAHASNFGTMNVSDTPLRQLISYAIGYIKFDEEEWKFVSENWMLPTLGSKALPLDKKLLNTVYGLSKKENDTSLYLGRDSRTGTVDIRANINSLLSRHLAVLGSTGYGKSNFNALIARQIVEKYPKSRIVIFDVNGEYAQAFEGLLGIKQTILGVGTGITATDVPFQKNHCEYHQIPYQALGWAGLIKLLRPSDKTQLPALRNSLSALTRVSVGKGGSNIFARLASNWFELVDDCRADNQENLGVCLQQLRNGTIPHVQNWPPFKALGNLVAEFGCVTADRNSGFTKRDAFNYGNVLPLVKLIQQLNEDARFNEVINTRGEQAISFDSMWQKPMEDEVDYIFGKDCHSMQSWRVHIINLKGLADDLSPMVLGSLLEMYSEVLFKRGQDGNYPTLLLLEEAHQYLRDPYAEDVHQLKAYERLAKEGRKFSCSLLVSTQRPSELSSTVLAMCANWISLRLTNERDLTTLRYAMENGNEHILSEISGLPRGDAVGFGSAFNLPVRFTIDKAVPGPSSSDANFASIWANITTD